MESSQRRLPPSTLLPTARTPTGPDCSYKTGPAPVDPRNDPAGEDGPSQTAAAAQTPPSPRRRLSMDEDLFYQRIMTAPPRRPSHPPPYDSVSPTVLDDRPSAGRGPGVGMGEAGAAGGESKSKDKARVDVESYLASSGRACDGRAGGNTASSGIGSRHLAGPRNGANEVLPDYSTSIALEGIFSKKHEIENTIKRAEDRQWHTVFVTLNGTALNVYNVKRDWGLGRSRDGPSINPDNPPWVKRSKIEKSYSLLHADAGIAADYKKRRYVIRVRAETDQFLLSCVELSTFITWLQHLFSAIDIAAPIDDRDFPRDMSVPRVQRIRWYRGQSPPRIPHPTSDTQPQDGNRASDDTPDSARARSQTSASRPRPPLSPLEVALAVQPAPRRVFERGREPSPPGGSGLRNESEVAVDDGEDAEDEDEDDITYSPPRIDPVHRLSTSSYPNVAIDPHSGKWFPEHQWSSAHDMLYAKLCYSNLLFRSPRKTNYIISKGKQWFVDWGTGRMVRVLPPTYGEVDYFGPWQVVHTENRRI